MIQLISDRIRRIPVPAYFYPTSDLTLGRGFRLACMTPVEETDGLRRPAEHFDEGPPHAFWVGETECLSDHLNRLCALLQSHAGGFDTKPLDGPGGRLAGLAPECPPELVDT